ncbi:MAG: hypothetical protein R3325_08345 [Thermoanaerobaculia bacterium]|nr:hypothetical protein [Thermoanaerobaculia bacterium]
MTGEPTRSGWSSGGRLWLATAAVFLLALVLLGLLTAQSPLLYDTDAYYHLTVARAQAEHGLVHPFPWVRFGLLARGLGDKELLFHAALAPFTALWTDPSDGGRAALAVLGALVLAAIGNLALRALGGWGAAVPFLVGAGALQFTWRLVRLRPELLSLLLLLVGLWLAARGRHRWLAPVGLLYALSYTAIHAFVGLFLLLLLAVRWTERRWEAPLLLYPLLGAGLGLLVHPGFPDNLVVWWFVAVEFFLLKGSLDVGTEIRPVTTDVALLANLGWWLALAVFWRSTRPEGGSGPDRRRATLFFGVAALVFSLLALLMSRFALYAVPFVTLWLLFRRGAAGPGARVELTAGRRLPAAVAWSLCLLAALPIGARELGRYLHRVDPGPGGVRLTDRVELGRALPAEAKVAAPWGMTPIYMFWAPQGRYLNVLDPGLLAAADPEVHRAQRAVFDGSEPDVPGVARAVLDSDHVAFNASDGPGELIRRLEGDPRVATLHRRLHALYALRPAPPGTFVLGWRRAPAGAVAGEIDPAGLDAWPAAGGGAGGRALPGYVAAAPGPRATAGCATFARRLEVAPGGWAGAVELAPYGPGELWVDGEIVLQVLSETRAVLGEGARVPLALGEGEHLLAVVSCPSRDPPYRSGFYLMRR